ncbi:hypothetical protein [Aliikangiella sp. G2MR2-5]|uniref:hypothetical protein n=1 Tax=Aliikangiella sp. G2MR2-5 TaxID=2788943 RepID=UPI0018AAC44D|nr:hypothetical protein [Aliikangiella sp. G2MR2-5]
MKKLLLSTIVASAVALAGTTNQAFAETPEFDYLQVSHANLDYDAGGDLDGFEVKWNHELTDSLYLNVDYTNFAESGAKVESTALGLGFMSDVSDSSTFFAQLDWINAENSFGFDDDGYRASVGVRSMLTKEFEGKLAYEYTDVGDDDMSVFVVGGAYNINKNIALTLDFKKESDFDQTMFGVRYNF